MIPDFRKSGSRSIKLIASAGSESAGKLIAPLDIPRLACSKARAVGPLRAIDMTESEEDIAGAQDKASGEDPSKLLNGDSVDQEVVAEADDTRPIGTAFCFRATELIPSIQLRL